ncbi:MAG: lysophospholipase [Gammaproteobacteria bacterium]
MKMTSSWRTGLLRALSRLAGRAAMALLATMLLAGCVGLPKVTPQPATYDTAAGAEAVLLKTGDGLTLFGQWWKPDGTEPRAAILLVHGTIAHSGFYAPWVNQLTARGYAVFGIDLRGWGQSQGHGRRGYVRDVSDYTDDVALAYREVRRVYPELPLYLQGESLGGGVAVLTELRGDLPLDGLILNAPGIKGHLGRFMPGWLADAGLWTIGTAGEAWPNFPVVPMGSKFLFDRVGAMIIFDPEVKDRAWNDPHMTHSALPVAWLTGVKDMSARANRNLPNMRTPFIVLHGTKDNLVPVRASRNLMEKAGSTDKTWKVYEGMSHCTLHDYGKEQVWADILAWLDERVPATAEQRTAGTSVAADAAATAALATDTQRDASRNEAAMENPVPELAL